MTAEQLAKRWLVARKTIAAAMSDLDEAALVRQQLRDAALNEYRTVIIEECARVADGFGYNMDIAKMLAAAIRALKDKP